MYIYIYIDIYIYNTYLDHDGVRSWRRGHAGGRHTL